jgi:ribosome-binding factor A
VSERDFSRLDRVRSTIRRVLAAPVAEYARGRGVPLVTITEVDVSPDLRHARVNLSVFGDGVERDAFVRDLAAHAAQFQHTLARSLRTRRTPVLAFRLDDALERGDRIRRLLDEQTATPRGD